MVPTRYITKKTAQADGPWSFMFFDGSCWPNPGGDMGVAWGIRPHVGPDSLPAGGEQLASPPSLMDCNFGPWQALVGDTLGPGSNNQAEYHALLGGLRHAHRLGVRRLVVAGDSLLVVRQMNRQWKIKSKGLRAVHAEALRLASAFTKIAFRHVRRERNAQVDDLSRKGPFTQGDAGFKPDPRRGGRGLLDRQAAFVQWAVATGKLTPSDLARVFFSDPSTMLKCATGETYGHIGEEHL